MTARNQSLDVLRGVAVLLVIGRHFDYFSPWYKLGWVGVDLFFVLSGFLISGLLFSELAASGTIQLKRFWIRRGFKIWPAFYFFLICVAVISLYGDPSFPWKTGFIVSGTFLRNYIMVPPDAIGHSWSLAVEEHFYIALPLLFLLIRKRISTIPWIFSVLAVSCFVLRAVLQAPGTDAMATHFRIDALFAGVFISYLRHFKSEAFARLTRWWAPAICILCCVPEILLPSTSHFIQTFGLSLLYVGFALLVAWGFQQKTPETARVRRAISKVGVYSYSIYLWHMPVAVLMQTMFPRSGLAFLFYICASLGIGIIAGRVIEVPFLRLRQRLMDGGCNHRAAGAESRSEMIRPVSVAH